MKNRLKTFALALTIGFSFISAPPASAYNPLCPTTDLATGKCTSGACKGNAETSPLCTQAKTQKTDPVAGPNGVISKAANLIAIVAAIGAVIMIIIGAFEFVTAGGTGFKSATANPAPTKAAKARARVTSGLIGLVIIAMAWVIVRIITDRVIK